MNHTNFLNTNSVGFIFVHVRAFFQANLLFDQSPFVAVFVIEFPIPRRVCQWKPFWIQIGESFKKAHLDEWIFKGDDSELPTSISYTALATQITYVMIIFQHPVHRNSQIPWAHTRRRDKANLWERLEAPLPLSRPRCNFIYPRQPGAFPQHLELLLFQVMKSFQATKMVPSRTSTFRVKMDPDKVLYIICLMIKKIPPTSRHQKGSLIHILGQMVSVNIAVIVYRCRSGSASTTGTLGADAEKKMPSQSRLQAGGMSLPCRKYLNMSIMTFLQACST